LLSVQNNIELNQSATLLKNDYLLEMRIAPQKMIRVDEKVKIETAGAGDFRLSGDDVFFAADSDKFGTVYCSTTNVHANASKTVLNQGCLGDTDKDGFIETFLSRTGANYRDVPGFVYYDSEVARLAPTTSISPIKYSVVPPRDADGFLITFRFKNMKKEKGGKLAVFDVLTRKPDDEQWQFFHTREPVEVMFPTDESTVTFDTPLFSAALSNPTLRSVDAQITSVASQSTFRYKRSLKNTTGMGLIPAYKHSGYN